MNDDLRRAQRRQLTKVLRRASRRLGRWPAGFVPELSTSDRLYVGGHRINTDAMMRRNPHASARGAARGPKVGHEDLNPDSNHVRRGFVAWSDQRRREVEADLQAFVETSGRKKLRPTSCADLAEVVLAVEYADGRSLGGQLLARMVGCKDSTAYDRLARLRDLGVIDVDRSYQVGRKAREVALSDAWRDHRRAIVAARRAEVPAVSFSGT